MVNLKHSILELSNKVRINTIFLFLPLLNMPPPFPFPVEFVVIVAVDKVEVLAIIAN